MLESLDLLYFQSSYRTRRDTSASKVEDENIYNAEIFISCFNQFKLMIFRKSTTPTILYTFEQFCEVSSFWSNSISV